MNSATGGFSAIRLGVLGGGQLGRMLLGPAARLGLSVHILDPDPACPCAGFCGQFTQGSFSDHDTVVSFGQGIDVLTIEIEHVNADALELLQSKGVRIAPSPATIRTIQDKGMQKQFFDQIGVPTADYVLLESAEDAVARFQEQGAFVQKLRTGGYDGKGVQVLRTADNLESVFDAPCVAEDLVDIEKELAVIVARNAAGEIRCFPLVEMVFNQELNLVDYLVSPASVPAGIADAAEEISKKVAAGLHLQGILAVELFLTRTGELLVNELAPRPHNSGHHTIEANTTSQYEQHLRAILDLPLGQTNAHMAAVMFNLVGSPGHTGRPVYHGLREALATPSVYPHIYGKSETKPGRKMGHVTVTGNSTSEVIEVSQRLKSHLRVTS